MRNGPRPPRRGFGPPGPPPPPHHRGHPQDDEEFGHHGPPWERGGRRRRGDIRTALLVALTDGPAHGYEVIQRLEEKTSGTWKPSPGSVYPTLQLLDDEGLVTAQERDGKRVYELTDAGRAEAAKRLEEAGGPPWADGGRSGAGQLRAAMMQLAMAAKQVAVAGRPDHIEKAAAIVNDARKKLYLLLSED